MLLQIFMPFNISYCQPFHTNCFFSFLVHVTDWGFSLKTSLKRAEPLQAPYKSLRGFLPSEASLSTKHLWYAEDEAHTLSLWFGFSLTLSKREQVQPMLKTTWECEGTWSGAVKPPRQAHHLHAAWMWQPLNRSGTHTQTQTCLQKTDRHKAQIFLCVFLLGYFYSLMQIWRHSYKMR